MKVKIEATRLNNAIGSVIRSVGTLGMQECIYLKAEGEKVLCRCTDGTTQIDVEMKEDVVVEESGEIKVAGRLFAEAIRKMENFSKTQISIETEAAPSMVVNVVGRGTKYKFTQRTEEYVSLNEGTGAGGECSIDVDQKTLKKGIKSVAYAAAQKDASKAMLTGVYMEAKKGDASDNGTITLVALDGFRMATCQWAIPPEKMPAKDLKAIIPTKTMMEVAKMLGSDTAETVKVTVNEAVFVAEMDNTRIVSRLIAGDYVDYRKLIPANDMVKSRITADVEEMSDALERAALISRDDPKQFALRFIINETTMRVTGNGETCSADTAIPINMVGEEQDIAFKPQYLMEALRALETECVQLEMCASTTPCVMKATVKEDKRDKMDIVNLVLPVRLAVTKTA